MLMILLSGVCILSYLIASLIPIRRLFTNKTTNDTIFKLFSFIALLLQVSLISLSTSFFSLESTISLNIIFSLTTLLIGGLVFSLGFITPLHHLSCIAYPLAIAGTLSLHAPIIPFLHPLALRWEIITHLILSLAAFSFLSMGALQALCMAVQVHLLKSHSHLAFLQRLPSIQQTERVIFQLLLTGTILLTLALLITLPLGMNALLERSIASKIILSLVAWCLFTTLLIGHYAFGWRGRAAIRWTLAATTVLTISYFGTKVIR